MNEPQSTFLYSQIAESIRRLIASGQLKPGDKLSPVRAMATRWHCTLGTVSRAYGQLAREGLLVGSRGGGTKVAQSILPPEPVSSLNWASLVNRAERFLLEALSSGHSPAQTELALSLAVSRWQEIQKTIPHTTKRAKNRPRETELRFIGSHDLLVEVLARMLSPRLEPLRLSVEFSGSLGGLIALARGEADLAGIHLWDQDTDSYNLPFVQRVLAGRKTLLLHLADRSLGLILARGNPLGIHVLNDLARRDVRFINRQAGSGTRVWLETQLQVKGIEPNQIPGYELEEFTHVATARAVAENRADAGLGIYAAASAQGLDFLPLTRERYDLAIPDTAWRPPLAEALREVIGSKPFQQAAQDLGGYDMSLSGQEIWIK